jgi:hypothetical protein
LAVPTWTDCPAVRVRPPAPRWLADCSRSQPSRWCAPCPDSPGSAHARGRSSVSDGRSALPARAPGPTPLPGLIAAIRPVRRMKRVLLFGSTSPPAFRDGTGRFAGATGSHSSSEPNGRSTSTPTATGLPPRKRPPRAPSSSVRTRDVTSASSRTCSQRQGHPQEPELVTEEQRLLRNTAATCR